MGKMAAMSLNGQKMGSKKGNFYAEDLWNLKYLPKFKWHNLTERLAHEERLKKERLKLELDQEQKVEEFYSEKMQKSRMISGIVRNKETKGKSVVAKKFRRANQKSIIGEGEGQWYWFGNNGAIKSQALLIIEYNLNKWWRTRVGRISETTSRLTERWVLWGRVSFTKTRMTIMIWFIPQTMRSLCLRTNRMRRTHQEGRESTEMSSKAFFM